MSSAKSKHFYLSWCPVNTVPLCDTVLDSSPRKFTTEDHAYIDNITNLDVMRGVEGIRFSRRLSGLFLFSFEVSGNTDVDIIKEVAVAVSDRIKQFYYGHVHLAHKFPAKVSSESLIESVLELEPIKIDVEETIRKHKDIKKNLTSLLRNVQYLRIKSKRSRAFYSNFACLYKRKRHALLGEKLARGYWGYKKAENSARVKNRWFFGGRTSFSDSASMEGYTNLWDKYISWRINLVTISNCVGHI